MTDTQPQKKRRQNVACDSCKLRRVKCDLTALLLPGGGFAAEGDDNPASLLQELVQQHPEATCTPCKNKQIPCTTESIRNPTKPKKGGKRITLARQLFGKDGEAEGSSEDVDTPDSAPGPSHVVTPHSTPPIASPSLFPRLDAFPHRPTTSYPSQSDPSQFAFSSSSTAPTPYDGVEHEGYRDEQDAFRIWRNASEDLVAVTANAPPLPISPNPANEDFGVAHGGQLERVKVNIEPTMNWMGGRPLYSSSIGGRAVKVQPYAGTSGSARRGVTGSAAVTARWGSTSETYFSSGDSGPSSRKRRMGDDGRAVVIAGDKDPWHMWPETNEIVSWGRREEVQERLADRALGLALSRHLVTVYFNVVHLAFPTVSPESFYVEWLRAGQCSDRMSPAQEALCAVVEAWGARYSDSPVVLGLAGTQAGNGPKVWKSDGTTIPGTAARVHWGRSRLSACNALAERAKKLIDYNGVMRRPTVTGIQALALYNLLATMTDQAERAADQYMQAIMTHSMVVEQMGLLQLMWDSDGQLQMDESELPCTNNVMRMKQRRIFWSAMVTDAMWAAGSAQTPKIPDGDVEAAAKWLNVVEGKLPNSSLKVLACFMRFYHRITFIARELARQVSIPNRRPGSINVIEFSRVIRKLWVELKTLRRDIVIDSAAVMEKCDHSLAGVSPLNHLTSLRLAIPFLLLLLHQHIRTQLDFRKSLRAAFIVDDVTQPQPEKINIAMMEELHVQSVDVVLQSSRAHVGMFKVMLPLGVMQTATTFLRDLIATALFVAEVPTVEQGYPSQTLGGYGWTWKTKQEEVGVCVDAMYQLGWAWADIGDVLDAVMLTMERMTPSQDVLNAYHQSSRPEYPLIAARLREEQMEDMRVMDQALVFWPPDSIPSLVDRAMKGIDVQNAPPVELSRRLAPDSMYARSISRDRRPHRRLNAKSLMNGGSTVTTPNTSHHGGTQDASRTASASASPFGPTGHLNGLAGNHPDGITPDSMVSAPTIDTRPNSSAGDPFSGLDSNLWQHLPGPSGTFSQFHVGNPTKTEQSDFITPFDYLFNSSPSKLFSNDMDFSTRLANPQLQMPLFPAPSNAGPSTPYDSTQYGNDAPSQAAPSYDPNYMSNPNQPLPTPSLWGFDFPSDQNMPRGQYLSDTVVLQSTSQTPTTSGSQSSTRSRSGSNEPIGVSTMSGQVPNWQQSAPAPLSSQYHQTSDHRLNGTGLANDQTLGEHDYAELQQFLQDLDKITVPGQPSFAP